MRDRRHTFDKVEVLGDNVLTVVHVKDAAHGNLDAGASLFGLEGIKEGAR